jgi:hypothetical protein
MAECMKIEGRVVHEEETEVTYVSVPSSWSAGESRRIGLVVAPGTRVEDIKIDTITRPEQREPDQYVLRLTPEEAQVLSDLFANIIAGDPARTRRSLTDGMARALREAGVANNYGARDMNRAYVGGPAFF